MPLSKCNMEIADSVADRYLLNYGVNLSLYDRHTTVWDDDTGSYYIWYIKKGHNPNITGGGCDFYITKKSCIIMKSTAWQ